MILLKLFLVFFKIGLFSFGGGLAMIHLIQEEVEKNKWMTSVEFGDVIALSQITPGALAVNTAIYTGLKIAGMKGLIFATLGVVVPSIILVIIIAKYFLKFKDYQAVESILAGIRPVSISLIGSATILLLNMSVFSFFSSIGQRENQYIKLFRGLQINIRALFIFLIIIFCVKKFNIHPIIVIILSAILGVLLF